MIMPSKNHDSDINNQLYFLSENISKQNKDITENCNEMSPYLEI